MLDLCSVFTRGGIVLWSHCFLPESKEAVEDLVKHVLVKEKAATPVHSFNSWTIKWKLANEYDLIFVAVYQKILHLNYVEELLQRWVFSFCTAFKTELSVPQEWHDFSSYDDIFQKLLHQAETRSSMNRSNKVQRKLKEKNEVGDNQSDTEKDDSQPLKGGRPRSFRQRKKNSEKNGNTKESKESKKPRVWDTAKVTQKDMERLDYSNDTQLTENTEIDKLVNQNDMGQKTNEGHYETAELEYSIDKVEDSAVVSFFKQITSGKKTLTEANISDALSIMKDQLITKNVAAPIAQHLCDSVGHGLVGKRISTFQGVKSSIWEGMERALQNVLMPMTSTDILRDIASSQKEGRPYSIVFVGVNGVGKSTNLSKTCFWLLQNNLKVLIAACDTFRSGAVEQLKVHQRNLRALAKNAVIDLYEKGYGKDAAAIAKDAINFGRTNGYDVVMIDTAGRMQDNEPLMRALAKLISVNNPDKIIFVGEALVGNEAIDQLTKFNEALKRFSGTSVNRQIDGMILTKFDTIDDKVGAAINMTYITGKPIFFVGTGQTYTDLKRMNIKAVVDTLLRS